MRKFFRFFVFYLCLLCVVGAVIWLDQTTPTFDRVRKTMGVDVVDRSGLMRVNSLPVVVAAIQADQLSITEGVSLFFAARRWPDYRPVLPDAPEGWDRSVPLMMDDSEIEALETRIAAEQWAFLGKMGGSVSSMPSELGDHLKAAMRDVQEDLTDVTTLQRAPQLGGLSYKASGARYMKDDKFVMVSINKAWRSSFGAINDLGDQIREVFKSGESEVYVDGRRYIVRQAGPFIRMEHNVGGYARVLVIGNAGPEMMMALVRDIDLSEIYRFHRNAEGEEDDTKNAPARKPLPTIR